MRTREAFLFVATSVTMRPMYACRRWMAVVVLLSTVLAACASDASLVVYLKTDLVAGVEFTSVELEVLTDNGRDEAAVSIGTRTLPATSAMRFVPERRVSSFDLAENQNLLVIVRLRDASGLILAERPTRLAFASDFGLRVVVTRNCARVACPSPGGEALNAACFDGRCVDDRCQPGAPEFCPAIACTSDATPPTACSTTAACADATCEDGVCIYSEPEESLCEAQEWCDPFRGCLPVLPAELLDAGVSDATIDTDAAGFDAEGLDAEVLDAEALDMELLQDMSVSPDMLTATDSGPSCASSEVLCGASCVDTEIDVHHCGDCAIDCTALPNVEASSASCEAGSCAVTCRDGFAHCESDPLAGCETDVSTASQCGTCTTSCSGATPVCSASMGGVYACSSGCGGSTPTRCGSQCVDLETDVDACGSCSRACPTSPNGHAECSAHTCSIVCDFGYHLCGSVCVSDNSILSCGSSCTTCPGAPAFAMATCDGVRCGSECQPGYHSCGGSCVPINSISACGAPCLVCSPPPSNGSASCDGVSCSVSCNVGYNSCSGSCVPANDPTHCGSSCTVCPVPTNGNATCASGSCGITCSIGYHACGGTCVSNASLSTCGASCGEAPCTAPSNGTPTCNGANCGFTCAAGFVASGSVCDVAPPRPIRPLSSSVATTQSPQLTWQLGAGSTGAWVEICADRACTTVVQSANASGSSYTPSPALAAGVYFWRLLGRIGASTGSTRSATWQFTVPARSGAFDSVFGQGLRDVDGDGYSDIALGNIVQPVERVSIFRGRSSGLSINADYVLTAGGASSRYGVTLALTDINRDGYADVIVGEPGYSSNTGRMHVHYGSASGPALTPSLTISAPLDAGASFAVRVHPAGDVNGDGFGDVMVGCTSFMAYVYYGSAAGLSTSPARGYANAIYTRVDVNAIATGDFNGDGFSDIAMPPASMAAYIYFGSATGLSATAGTLVGTGAYSRIVAADVNADGYSDLIKTTNSALEVYAGAASGSLALLSTLTVPAPEGNTSFGYYLAVPGDLNGDGFPDLVIASKDAGFGVGVGTGRAWVYTGSAAGFGTVPSQTLYNPTTLLNGFGTAVGLVGDVDGDGRVDVQIGTYSDESYFYAGMSGMFGVAPTPTMALFAPTGYTGVRWASGLATQ